MAKTLTTYPKERDGFLRDLHHFHETRGTPFKRPPVLGGKEVDLYLLYSLVTSQGGWIKVNSKNAWDEILEELNLTKECVNGSIALKQIYLRYLDRWEKVHFLGEEADRGSDEDEESRHKRWSARALHSVPHTYNYSQHNIAEANREYNHLSTNIFKASDYDKLALSLLSPLPNEQDFAINVCTLLSNDGKHTLKLEKHPRLIDYLLGHAGVFSHNSLRKLFIYNYTNVRKQPVDTFWKDVVELKEFLDLTNENIFKVKEEKNESKNTISDNASTLIKADSLATLMEVDDTFGIAKGNDDEKGEEEVFNNSQQQQQSSSSSSSSSDCEYNVNSDELKLFGEFSRIKLQRGSSDGVGVNSDEELFCLGRALGTQDYIGQRVMQIATILRNLSFVEENVPVLLKNKTFLRFLLLCSLSRWSYLRNLGFDMLGNIAGDFLVKDYPNDRLSVVLLKLITTNLKSEDRAASILSLEVLNKLSQNESNEDTLQRYLDIDIYEKVCSFLTIHDVMLLIYTLECLYSLSSLGERSCNLIVSSNHGVVDTLVSLVTVEGKSYGPKACIGMKLVETVPGGNNINTSSQQSTTSTTTTTTTTLSTTITNTSSSTTTIVNSTAIVSSSGSTLSKTTTTCSTPLRTVQIAPQRLLALSPSSSSSTNNSNSVITTTTTTTMTPQQLIQQQHAHQQAIHENEQFALAWLRATYEPCTNSKIDHQELYKQYLNSCSKIGRRGVISPLHFPRCVRSVFGGTVGPNPMKSSGNETAQYYEGIKVRNQPLIINIQTSLPISSTLLSQQQTIITTTTTTTTPKGQNRRKTSTTTTTTTVVSDDNNDKNATTQTPSPQPQPIPSSISPASPILKAQLSAPPKQRDTTAPGDIKSQVMAHPHLSQALLGSSTSTTTSVATIATTAVSSKENSQVGGQSNTSLIKSLLATKVNDCMTTVSMRTATDCQNVAQVAARQQQQKLLAQQQQTTPKTTSRVNGARQLFNDNEIGDSSVSSTTTSSTFGGKGKKEPPQPPPPPLAPLSSSNNNRIMKTTNRLDNNEDSDSLASSSGVGGCIIGGGIATAATTTTTTTTIEDCCDGDNSLTSFEGLLNGVPNIDNNPLLLNEEDSNNSKDSMKYSNNEITKNKPLRLADLLEKKVEKGPLPTLLLNGVLGKELRLGDKLDLVENHIEKALSREQQQHTDTTNLLNHKKRPASDDIVESDPKKPMLLLQSINGSSSSSSNSESSPPPPPSSQLQLPLPSDSISCSSSSSNSNGSNTTNDAAAATTTTTVSTAAAKLFADIAADILEDEDEEQLLQEAAQIDNNSTANTAVIATTPSTPQLIMDNNNQQVLLAQPRQIIVSQAQATQIKSGTVIVQNSQLQQQQQRSSVVLQQNAGGQILLSQGLQGLQGQVQIVASTSQPGQYVLQTSGTPQGTYVVAQPQTAVVHGQQQTVLVAQTQQQQGTATKTIIILQQQPTNTGAGATHHQKVMVTPQGQQVVVTQVHRPILHTSSVTNNILQANNNSSVIKQNPILTTTTTTTNGNSNVVVIEKKEEKPRIIRDLSTAFVCEWGDCNIDIKFKSANHVYMHVCEAHCPTGSEEIVCQWDRCDNMKRKRFSLMTHLHDKHCNTEAMKQSLLRRKQLSQGGKVEPAPPTPSTPHPVYAPDAALHAIKRHALEFVNPKELQQQKSPTKQGTPSVSVPPPRPPPTDQDDNEGPVTKSIRLTASLILRNLVIYSSNCRRYLKPYEAHLANVALSNVESSRTIAQVLYDMNEGSSSHR